MNRNEICADDGHESFVAEVFDQTDEWRANARLIAAAPDLLEALETVNAQSIDTRGDDFPYPVAEAALRLAKGR